MAGTIVEDPEAAPLLQDDHFPLLEREEKVGRKQNQQDGTVLNEGTIQSEGTVQNTTQEDAHIPQEPQ